MKLKIDLLRNQCGGYLVAVNDIRVTGSNCNGTMAIIEEKVIETDDLPPLEEELPEKKRLEAFEIVKEKEVDVLRVKVCDTAEQYNESRIVRLNARKRELTRSEFNSVKEALG